MEEKKKRPRISKQDGGFSLKERPKVYFPDDENDRSEDSSEKKPWTEKPIDPDRPNRPFDQNRERRPYDPDRQNRPPFDPNRERRPYDPDRQSRPPYDQNRERRPYDPDRQNRPFDPNRERRPYDPDRQNRPPYDQNRERRPYDPDRQNRPPFDPNRERRPYDSDRPSRPFDPNRERRPYDSDRPSRPFDPNRERRPYDSDRPSRPFDPNRERRPYDNNREGGYRKPYGQKPGFGKKPFRKKEEFYIERKPKPGLPSGEGMPLNKYLAHCGVASRRKAVEYIEQSLVTVNGEVKLEPYYRIAAGDVVMCEGKNMQIQERQIYLLLNKPKGAITTTDDEHGRPTVLDIVDPHYPERIYPVGRLDRDTTGLLIITNDGDLAAKLSHPSYKILKQYRVGLDHGLSEKDYERIVAGVELEDGTVSVNWVRFAEDHPDRDIVELEIVVGRNRVVRRLFEALGYRVRKLDRFYFAGLTKKDLPRGAFRELTQREIIMLKHFTGTPNAEGYEQEKEETDTNEDTKA